MMMMTFPNCGTLSPVWPGDIQDPKKKFTFADELVPYFYIWNTTLVLTFMGGGNWCISKTCACWWHLGSGCLTDIIFVISFSKTIVLVNEHEQSFGWDLEKFLLSSPEGGSRGWYGGWEESDRWRKEESGKDFFRECCNNNTLILLFGTQVFFGWWKLSLFCADDIPVLFYLGNRSICCCSRHSCLCGKHHRSMLSATKTAFTLYPLSTRHKFWIIFT